MPANPMEEPTLSRRRLRLGKITREEWLPSQTAESDAMSKDLKKRGFTFVGSTICYAFMQAVGLVNDHFVTCFRYRQV